LNFEDTNIVLLPDKYVDDCWRYSIGGKMSSIYPSQEKAKLGAFDAVMKGD